MGRPRVRNIPWAWGLLGLFAGLVVLNGCAPPFDDVLVNDDGEQIRVEGVGKILDDDTLTEEEKRDALERYGITDEALIDALLQL
jgi:hypothetical protein